MDMILLDYLDYTIKTTSVSTVNALSCLSALYGSELSPSKHSFSRGYDAGGTLAGGNVRASWHTTRLEMGVHVSLSGKSISFLRSLPQFSDFGFSPFDFIAHLYSSLVPMLLDNSSSAESSSDVLNITRVDFALDDVSGLLRMPILEHYVANRNFTSVFQSGRQIKTTFCPPSEPIGNTLYFGSSKSDLMLRIYDKAAQMADKSDYDHWIRVELQLRRKRAREVCLYLLDQYLSGDNCVSYIAGFVLYCLDFKSSLIGHSNVSRIDTASWWSSFLLDDTKVKISSERFVPDLDSKKEWVRKYISPTLAMINISDLENGDVENSTIHSYIDEATGRLTSKHLDILRQSRYFDRS
jgi:hypothetical protein